MRYGERASDRPERFAPGAFVRDGDTWLDLEHDRSRILTWEGAGLSFDDSPAQLAITARLPRNPLADLALSQVESGERRGLSVEFESLEERTEAQTGVRLIERARLAGVGLVRAPSYAGSTITEVRQRLGPSVSGSLTLGSLITCRCKANIDTVMILPEALDDAIAEAEAGNRVVTAFLSGLYSRPLASIGNGLSIKRRGNRLIVRLDGLPDPNVIPEVAAFLESQGRTLWSLRPYIDFDNSDWRLDGRTAVIERGDLRGMELAVITGVFEGYQRLRVGAERRARLWL